MRWMFAVVFVALFVGGCLTDSSDKNDSTKELIGSWAIKNSLIDILEFGKDGTYNSSYFSRGNYSVSGDVITFSSADKRGFEKALYQYRIDVDVLYITATYYKKNGAVGERMYYEYWRTPNE